MAEKKTKYKLVRGKHEGFDEEGNPKRYVAGDWLLLTDSQAKAFRGKVKSEAEVKLDGEREELDKRIYATDAMTPTREQPLAPLEPTEEDSNKLEDPVAQEALDKQTAIPTQEPSTTQAKPAAPAPVQPVKPATPTK